MAVRKQRATTSEEIMENDINVAIKKAKVRFRSDEAFYILKYAISSEETYFASKYPELDNNTREEIYYQKWVFKNKKWKCE